MSQVNDEIARRIALALISTLNESKTETSGKLDKGSNSFEYHVITADEILQMEGESLPYLVDPLFPRQGLVGFAGSSDTGKSTLLKQLAVSITRGENNFLGFPLLAKHRSVIYVSTEDDVHAVKSVLKKQRKKGTRSSTVKDLRFLFNTEHIFSQVKEELQRQAADVVIIDAFSDIAPGDLNQSNVVRPFLDKFSNLSKEHECLIIFLHHTRKSSEGQVPKKGNLLGSQGFEAKCRLVAMLVRDPNEDSIRHFCLVKGNYLGDEAKSKSYVLEFKEDLTFDNTGERLPLEELQVSEDQYIRKQQRANDKKKALELRQKGWKLESIAIELAVDKSTVSRWLKDLPSQNKSEKSAKDDIPLLKEKLESFIIESKEYTNKHDLISKYENASKGLQGRIRSDFKKYLKQKKVMSISTFMKVLEK